MSVLSVPSAAVQRPPAPVLTDQGAELLGNRAALQWPAAFSLSGTGRISCECQSQPGRVWDLPWTPEAPDTTSQGMNAQSRKPDLIWFPHLWNG